MHVAFIPNSQGVSGDRTIQIGIMSADMKEDQKRRAPVRQGPVLSYMNRYYSR